MAGFARVELGQALAALDFIRVVASLSPEFIASTLMFWANWELYRADTFVAAAFRGGRPVDRLHLVPFQFPERRFKMLGVFGGDHEAYEARNFSLSMPFRRETRSRDWRARCNHEVWPTAS